MKTLYRLRDLPPLLKLFKNKLPRRPPRLITPNLLLKSAGRARRRVLKSLNLRLYRQVKPRNPAPPATIGTTPSTPSMSPTWCPDTLAFTCWRALTLQGMQTGWRQRCILAIRTQPPRRRLIGMEQHMAKSRKCIPSMVIVHVRLMIPSRRSSTGFETTAKHTRNKAKTVCVPKSNRLERLRMRSRPSSTSYVPELLLLRRYGRRSTSIW